ncbi:MAG: tyrosine-type recombinase/integrase [Chthoniobacterales bacterium]
MPTKKSPPKQQYRRVAEGIYQYGTSGAYYARFRHKGNRVFELLGSKKSPCTSLPEAKRLLRQLRQQKEQTDAKASRLSLHQVVEEYRKTMDGAPSTKAYKTTHLDLLKKAFPATKKAADVTTHDLRLFLKNYEKRSPATVNKVITVLRDVFDTAVENRSIPISPAAGIKYKKVGDEIKRLTPSLEEFRAIVSHIRSQKLSDTAAASGDLVEFMGLAGLGQGECSGLHWQDVNFQANTIMVIRLKTRKQFTIPIYPQLRGLLERMNNERVDPQPEDKIFSVRNPKKSLKDACKRLKLPDCTARSLRRMFIREARRRGVPAHFVAKWQGHKDIKMVMRIYDEPTDAEGMKMAALLTDNPADHTAPPRALAAVGPPPLRSGRPTAANPAPHPSLTSNPQSAAILRLGVSLLDRHPLHFWSAFYTSSILPSLLKPIAGGFSQA